MASYQNTETARLEEFARACGLGADVRILAEDPDGRFMIFRPLPPGFGPWVLLGRTRAEAEHEIRVIAAGE